LPPDNHHCSDDVYLGERGKVRDRRRDRREDKTKKEGKKQIGKVSKDK